MVFQSYLVTSQLMTTDIQNTGLNMFLGKKKAIMFNSSLHHIMFSFIKWEK